MKKYKDLNVFIPEKIGKQLEFLQRDVCIILLLNDEGPLCNQDCKRCIYDQSNYDDFKELVSSGIIKL